MAGLFDNNLQKAGSRYLDSQTRLNNFSLTIGIGSVIVIIVFGLKLAGALSGVLGS
jgi:hypothetical protein